MKKTMTFALLLSLVVSGATLAQSNNANDPHSGHHASPAASASYSTSGVVKKVDAVKGIISFAHEPIPALGWPAMTMNFLVKDKALFSKLKVGKKVTIEFQQQSPDNVLTNVK